MTVSEKDIKMKSYEHQILALRDDIASASITLGETLKKRDSIEQEMQDFRDDKEKFEREKIQYSEKHYALKRKYEEEIRLVSEEKSLSSSQLALVQSELREAKRDLFKVNGQCLSANNDIEKLKKDIIVLNTEIEKLTLLVIHIEEAKTKLQYLEEEFNRTNERLVRNREIADLEIRENTEHLRKLMIDTETVEQRKGAAEYELKSYTDQLYTAMNDYHVVKLRLEEKWHQTFPELEIPLAL